MNRVRRVSFLFFILFDQFIYLKLVFAMFITLCVGEDGSGRLAPPTYNGRLAPPSGRIPEQQVSPKESPVLQKRVYDIEYMRENMITISYFLNTLK